MPGPALPSDTFEYVGVFIADAAKDKSFADSEPPAHDAWEPASVKSSEARSVVKVALDKVATEMRNLAQPACFDGALGQADRPRRVSPMNLQGSSLRSKARVPGRPVAALADVPAYQTFESAWSGDRSST